MNDFAILIILSIFYVLAGACNAGFNKYIVSQEALGLKFSHGWFLNLVMFVGESMGIPVFYLFFNKKNSPKENNDDTKYIQPINKEYYDRYSTTHEFGHIIEFKYIEKLTGESYQSYLE